MMQRFWILPVLLLAACAAPPAQEESAPAPAEPAKPAKPAVPEAQYSLTRDQTHNRFSRTIPPVLTVPSGAVIQVETEEASDGQITRESTVDALATLDFDPIHPLTGPIYVEGAEPGDVLAVTLHSLEMVGWGWTAVTPGFGFLAEEFTEAALRIFEFEPGADSVGYKNGMRIPLRPFPGVVAVAPDTDEMLRTIPPRANGGNMDDRDLIAGTTIYMPVFVEGALFSIGDTHAAQGDGEVCGTAIEAPMTVVLSLEVLKGGRTIEEPQYERDDLYAVTAYGLDIDEAARKATRYMVDYLEAEHGLERTEAYMLCSLAAHLKIAEVVDVPHMLVTMQLPKEVLGP